MKAKKTSELVVIAISLCLFSLGASIGESIPAKNQLEHYKALREVAAFVFAVAGLWLGFVYPKAMRAIVSNSLGNTKEARRAKAILSPAAWSIGIVFISLLFGVVRDILLTYEYLHQYAEWFRRCSFGLYLALLGGLGITTMKLLVPHENMRTELEADIKNSEYHLKAHSVSKTRRSTIKSKE